MLAYSPMFGAPSGVFDDDPSIYYNGLQDQDFSYDHYSQLAILSPNIEYPIFSFDDQLIPLSCSPNVAFGVSTPLPMPTSTTPPMVSSEWHYGKPAMTLVEAKEEVEILVVEKKKKEDHNSSERNRRKRINELYASLRRLLPVADHMKKMSVPSTVGRALKYIPQLQNEVQDLLLRKEQLLLCIDKTSISSPPSSSSSSSSSSCTSVEATQLGNGEISIQISALKPLQGTVSVPISEVLRALEEEDGVVVVDVSSSESTVGRVFYRIHLMVEATHNIKCELLRGKITSWCQKWENLYSCLWMN